MLEGKGRRGRKIKKRGGGGGEKMWEGKRGEGKRREVRM